MTIGSKVNRKTMSIEGKILTVMYSSRYVEETTKRDIKKTLIDYDRSLLVADPRKCEPKKFGGRGARARYQMSFR